VFFERIEQCNKDRCAHTSPARRAGETHADESSATMTAPMHEKSAAVSSIELFFDLASSS